MEDDRRSPLWRRIPCPATLSYIVCIICINALFTYVPTVYVHGSPVSPADLVVGVIYVLRDFAQREVKHWVLLAMIIGALLSYVLALKIVAIASLCAFVVGETLDWSIFTFTKKPFSERILWSSLISTPADSFVFLYMMHALNLWGVILLTAGKFIGVLGLWGYWKYQKAR